MLERTDFLPLISESESLRPRFNPYFLKHEEKIKLLQSALGELLQIHSHHRALSKDFKGDDIFINPHTHEISIPASDFTPERESHSKVLKDIALLFSTLEKGLDIKSPLVKLIMERFIQKGLVSDDTISTLLTELESVKSLNQMGMDIFETALLPQAGEETKNLFCIMVRNVNDGVGDFEHAWDLASKAKPFLQSKGYHIFGLIETESGSPGSSEEARCNYVINKLKQENSPFDDYLRFTPDIDNFDSWRREHAAQIERFQKNVVGAWRTSYPPKMLTRLLPNHINLIGSSQYGSSLYSTRDMLSQAPMKLRGTSEYHSYGIKIHKPPEQNDSASTLLSLLNTEGEFVRKLVSSQTPDESTAISYLQTHHFMPAYLQTNVASCSFILTNVLHHQKNDRKICDFFLPKNVVDENMIRELLVQQGVAHDEISFIYSDSTTDDSEAKIRIFCFRIKSDEDYNKLYHISSDGAGASGDNSLSILFSSQHFPWYQYKNGPIGRFYTEELFTLVDNCKAELEYLGDPELIKGIEALKAYFVHLSNLANACEDRLPSDAQAEQEDMEWYRSRILSKGFSDYCRQSADYLQSPYIVEAWNYVSRHIHQYNFYDQVENIIKASILGSTRLEMVIDSLKHTEEFQCAWAAGIISEKYLSQPSSWKELVRLANPRFYLLATEMKLSSRSAAEFFSLIANSDEYVIKRFQDLISKINLTLNDHEKEVLFNSPIILIGLFTNMLTPEVMKWQKPALLSYLLDRTFTESDITRVILNFGVTYKVNVFRIFVEELKNNSELSNYFYDAFELYFKYRKEMNILDLPIKEGKTLLMMAVQARNIKIVEMLIKCGAYIGEDQYGHSILWHALDSRSKFFSKDNEIELKLIELGAPIDPNELLGLSIRLDAPVLLRKSIECGADVNDTNKPPLVFALNELSIRDDNFSSIIDILIEKTKDISILNYARIHSQRKGYLDITERIRLKTQALVTERSKTFRERSLQFSYSGPIKPPKEKAQPRKSSRKNSKRKK